MADYQKLTSHTSTNHLGSTHHKFYLFFIYLLPSSYPLPHSPNFSAPIVLLQGRRGAVRSQTRARWGAVGPSARGNDGVGWAVGAGHRQVIGVGWNRGIAVSRWSWGAGHGHHATTSIKTTRAQVGLRLVSPACSPPSSLGRDSAKCRGPLLPLTTTDE